MILGAGKDFPGWLFDASIQPNAKIKQGDLILFKEESDVLRSIGIVVTADCDLARGKHGRMLTLVSIMTARSILEYYLIPEDCENKRAHIENFVFSAYGIVGSKDLPSNMALLHAKIDEGYSVAQIAQVAASFLLGKTNGISHASYSALMTAMKLAPKKPESFLAQLQSRGDLMILPDAKMVGLEGVVAWVRSIWQVPVTDVSLRTSEANLRPGERVARLDSPYRYRLTQLMGQVFSDIGLPDMPVPIDRYIHEACGNV